MWEQLIVAIVLMIVSSMMTSAAKPNINTPEPGKLDTPTAEEGKDIPVVFGTEVIKDANVCWYGDSNAVEIHYSGGGKK